MYKWRCTDRLERRFEQQLIGSVQSFVDAARRVAMTTCYVMLVALATSFSLRVAALLVSRRLAVTTPRLDDGQSVWHDRDVVNDVSDDDNDDDDVGCGHCDVIGRHDDDAPPPLSVSMRPCGILHSLKFYETNV